MGDGVRWIGDGTEEDPRRAVRVLRFDLPAYESWLRTCEAAWSHRQHDARERTQALLMRAQAELNRLERAAIREAVDRRSLSMSHVPSDVLSAAQGFVMRVADLLAANTKTGLNLPGRGATPELLTRPGRFDPVLRLAEQNRIDRDQLEAARWIRDLVELVVAGSGARAINLNAGRAPSSGAIPAQIAEQWSLIYVPWSREQQRLQAFRERHLPLTLDIVVWGRGLRERCARYQLGRHAAYAVIAGAMDDWLHLAWSERKELWDRRYLQMAEARATAPIRLREEG